MLKKRAINTPSEKPVDILGSNNPTTPPTSAPVPTRTMAINSNSFISGSDLERGLKHVKNELGSSYDLFTKKR